MDRFIVEQALSIIDTLLNLKSSMDRFIIYNYINKDWLIY